MRFVRTVKNSDDLIKKKKIRGVLSKYKDKTLQVKESEAWSKAVVEKYENS